MIADGFLTHGSCRRQPDRNMKQTLLMFAFAILSVTFTPGRVMGQSASKPSTPPDNPGAESYTAEKDVEVANFYMHKGDVDAAILRLQDAIKTKPSFAKPHLMLAEAYEKKDMKSQALKYYHEYLTVFPTAPDAKKVQKKIDKLDAEIAARYESNH